MSEYVFGLGSGHLSASIKSAAHKLGARVVNHTDPSCLCGYGCRPFTCKRARRHWLTVPNVDNALARAHAKKVLDGLSSAGYTEVAP